MRLFSMAALAVFALFLVSGVCCVPVPPPVSVLHTNRSFPSPLPSSPPFATLPLVKAPIVESSCSVPTPLIRYAYLTTPPPSSPVLNTINAHLMVYIASFTLVFQNLLEPLVTASVTASVSLQLAGSVGSKTVFNGTYGEIQVPSTDYSPYSQQFFLSVTHLLQPGNQSSSRVLAQGYFNTIPTDNYMVISITGTAEYGYQLNTVNFNWPPYYRFVLKSNLNQSAPLWLSPPATKTFDPNNWDVAQFLLSYDVPGTNPGAPGFAFFLATLIAVNRYAPFADPLTDEPTAVFTGAGTRPYDLLVQFTGTFQTIATNSTDPGFIYPYDIIQVTGFFNDDEVDFNAYTLQCLFTWLPNGAKHSARVSPINYHVYQCSVPDLNAKGVAEGTQITLSIVLQAPPLVNEAPLKYNGPSLAGTPYANLQVYWQGHPYRPSATLSESAIIAISVCSGFVFLVIVGVLARILVYTDCWQERMAERRRLRRPDLKPRGGGRSGPAGAGAPANVNNYTRFTT